MRAVHLGVGGVGSGLRRSFARPLLPEGVCARACQFASGETTRCLLLYSNALVLAADQPLSRATARRTHTLAVASCATSWLGHTLALLCCGHIRASHNSGNTLRTVRSPENTRARNRELTPPPFPNLQAEQHT